MKIKSVILLTLLTASTAFGQQKAPSKAKTTAKPTTEQIETENTVEASPTEKPAAPVRNQDPQDDEFSHWRPMVQLGGGTLSARGQGSSNTLEEDYDTGVSGTFGFLMDYRPSFRMGLDFGVKFISMSRSSDLNFFDDLSLNISYLAIPIEFRYLVLRFRKQSGMYVKGGLTYMSLLSAKIEEDDDSDSGWGDWDLTSSAFPTTPTKGNYKSSFTSNDTLASLGVGFDFNIFTTKSGFNMSILPEVMLYQGLRRINRNDEFGGDVYNRGVMFNAALAFGF